MPRCYSLCGPVLADTCGMESQGPTKTERQVYTLKVAAAVCQQAAELCEAADKQGNRLETSLALVRAFDELTISRDDLVRVWAIVQLTSFAAKQVAEHKQLEDEETDVRDEAGGEGSTIDC